jgi:hypothetical protein
MGVVISTQRELESGAGFYGFSASVSCDTNEKTVILIQDSGYRDTNIQVYFGGSVLISDPAAGSISIFQIKLNDQVVWQTKLNTVDQAPRQSDCMLFIPRNSSVQITQTDADTTGSCTTMLRGFYLEPPVAQQG